MEKHKMVVRKEPFRKKKGFNQPVPNGGKRERQRYRERQREAK